MRTDGKRWEEKRREKKRKEDKKREREREREEIVTGDRDSTILSLQSSRFFLDNRS